MKLIADLVAPDYEPCQACAKLCRMGLWLIECNYYPNSPGQGPLNATMHMLFPTGDAAIVRRASAIKIGVHPDIITRGVLATTPEGFREILYKTEVERFAHTVGAYRNLVDVPERLAR
jgi:hypothetical protein